MFMNWTDLIKDFILFLAKQQVSSTVISWQMRHVLVSLRDNYGVLCLLIQNNLMIWLHNFKCEVMRESYTTVLYLVISKGCGWPDLPHLCDSFVISMKFN